MPLILQVRRHNFEKSVRLQDQFARLHRLTSYRSPVHIKFLFSLMLSESGRLTMPFEPQNISTYARIIARRKRMAIKIPGASAGDSPAEK